MQLLSIRFFLSVILGVIAVLLFRPDYSAQVEEYNDSVNLTFAIFLYLILILGQWTRILVAKILVGFSPQKSWQDFCQKNPGPVTQLGLQTQSFHNHTASFPKYFTTCSYIHGHGRDAVQLLKRHIMSYTSHAVPTHVTYSTIGCGGQALCICT